MTENKRKKIDESGMDEEKMEQFRKQLREITQETRFDILKTILMHPEELPSLEEINFMNPDRSKATLREHLGRLIDSGIVARVELPDDEVTRDNPKVFFGLTDEGRTLLQKFDLLSMKDTFRTVYENTDKPEWIQRYEDAPRPSDDEQEDETQATV